MPASTPPTPNRPSRALAFLPIAVAALSAVAAAQTIAHDPRFALPLVAFAALLFAPALLGRWRMRRILMSGDVERVIGTWAPSIDRVAHRETMAPLLLATAYAANGWVDAARRALDRAVKGQAWDAALEQRLFVEVLLDAFEGERGLAVRKATMLDRQPLPAAGLLARRRIRALRRGLAALARAFAHEPAAGDRAALLRASSISPLVHWAMRYAAAIVAIDSGKPGDVAALLEGAPAWPSSSVFHVYGEELRSEAARPRSRGGPDLIH
jgi:hypothetical protein